ncbi:MAG: phosphoribosylglycinamide formyltransferase [Brevundimonas sp.]|uniref:phosphoribosylglycinamide formyltransferase n=1 Tax=Brevundimonas sp. TaxID=1871086 RepID=UPI0027336FF4|nr:phosphoribosylglycinamide formyltransferase [Brevundimonas sp.]MDP3376927.1 phosphoribosylglycinamide formyltransferase [Brevundimonas sp.]
MACPPVRVAVLISGTGSNLRALVEPADTTYQVALVLSNRPEAIGLAWAAEHGIPAVALPHAPYGKDRQAHEVALDETLRAHDIQVVALAGYMRVLTPWLVGRWSGRMLNIHPSLLPKYPGLDTHRRALDAGDVEAGCTVHLVSEGVDEGPILDQARVPVLDGDTPETLAARVLQAEHRLYPRALARFCAGL